MPPLYPSFTPTYHHEAYPAIDPTQPSLSCEGKVVLITGGGKGIGKAIATGFAKAHAKAIIILGRTQLSLTSTATELKEISGSRTEVLTHAVDILDIASVQQAFDASVQALGQIDILVNNAGGLFGIGSVGDVDIDDFWKAFELNVKGPLIVTQAFIKAAAHSSGLRTIINISSGGAHLPYAPMAAAYGTSKLAFTKVTEYVANEHADWRVFNMQPGVVQTDLAVKAGRKGIDDPALPGSFAVWLAASPDAEFLKGRFVWANWDVEELIARKDEIVQKDTLKIWLRGWGEELNSDELAARAKSVSGDARREK